MTCADSFKSILKKEKDFSYETDSSSSYSTVHSCGGLSPNVVAVLGCQWGDEAKGKLVGLMCPYADVCCRFNGGSNAGHTLVIKNKRYPLHLVPCGILQESTLNFIGNGVVLHLKSLLEELQNLKDAVPNALQRLFISSRAHLLFDFHIKADALMEEKKEENGTKIGTTCKGIGPCYSTKASRLGLRVADLSNFEIFKKKYRTLLKYMVATYGIEFNQADDELKRHAEYFKTLQHQIVDGVEWLHSNIQQNKVILAEGANATLLDLDFGTYPFVTSSSTTAGGVCTGLGIPPNQIRLTIGVMKAYTTRVGLGPFPTELYDAFGETLREQGHEYGTTTGRPRRCGWFDAQLVRYSVRINGIQLVNLTKLDVLSKLTEIKVCHSYKNRISGNLFNHGSLPVTNEDYENVEPLYKTLEGWNCSITHCRHYNDLPDKAKIYINYIEELVQCPIVWIGVGPDAAETIYRPNFRN